MLRHSTFLPKSPLRVQPEAAGRTVVKGLTAWLLTFLPTQAHPINS